MRVLIGAGATALALALSMAAGPAGAAAEPVQEPERALARHFSVLRTPPEGLSFWQGPPGCPGLNLELAQKIEGIPGRRMFLIPGEGCLELVNMGPAARPYPILAGVRSARTAIRHGIETGGTRFGFGIVPDGVIAARLSATVTLPVRHGTFYVVPYRRLDPASLWTKARLIFGASLGSR